MDVRPDTSSGRSQDGWSFLNQGGARDAQTRSQPPSSYLRSDRSSLSPLPNGQSARNGSRSSFSRNLASASTGARSTTTIPSQPVVARINSANAHNHNNQFPRMSRRPMKIDKESGLPAKEEFSIQGILDAIHEDIEGDLNTIAEILGRSRFVLADQHEAQMPPQGEIVLGLEQGHEVGPANIERYDDDNVMILNEDASLVEGSNSGSAAYGLLERLQAVPRPARINSDADVFSTVARPDVASPVRTHSSPAAIQPEPASSLLPSTPAFADLRERSPALSNRGPAEAVVSNMYLSVEANRVHSVSGPRRQDPIYPHDDTSPTQTSISPRSRPTTGGRFGGWIAADYSALTSWFSRGRRVEDEDAEARLRGLLGR